MHRHIIRLLVMMAQQLTTWITGDSSGNLTFKRIATGDNNPYVMTLHTGETDISIS